MINWARPNGEIQEALKEWLEANRRHPDFRQGSVTDARDHLKQLGAMRVLDANVSSEWASDHNVRTRKRNCPLYGSPTEYSRAKKKAAKVLRNLFPSDT